MRTLFLALVVVGGAWFALGGKKDPAPPTILILSPMAGSTVDQTIQIALQTKDNVGVVRLIVNVDGKVICDSTATPAKVRLWSCAWNSALPTEHQRTIQATAYDAAGNTGIAMVNVISAALLQVITQEVPGAVCEQPYRAVIQATGGIKPYAWSVIEGALSGWMVLTQEGDNLVISGTPPAGCDMSEPAQLLARLRNEVRCPLVLPPIWIWGNHDATHPCG